MAASEPPYETERDDGGATFGGGLGVDFKPIGRRIVVPKARDGSPLKIKIRRVNDSSEN